MTTVSLAAAYLELLFSPARLSLTAALLLVAAIVAEAGSRLAARVAQSATRDSVLSPHYAHLTTFIDGVAHAPIQHVISFAVAQASAGVIDAGLHAGLHLLRGARLSVPSAASIAMGIYSATSAAFFLGCSMDWFLPRKWRGLSYLLFALTAGMLRVHAAAYDSCPFTLDILLGAAATQLLPCIALGGVAVAVPLLAPSCVLPPLSANTNADAGKGGGGGSGGATLAIARRFALYSAHALALACAHVWAEHIGASAVGSMRPLGMCGTAAAAGYNGGTGSSSLSSSSSGVLTACRYALHLALLWWGRSVLRAYVAAVRMVRGKTRMLRARHGLSLSPDSAVWSMLRMRLRAPPQMSKAWRRTLVLLGEIDVIALPWQLLHLIVAQPTTPQPPSPAAAAGAGQQGPSTPSTPPPAPAPVSARDMGLLDPFLKVTSALLNALSTANALSSLVSARTLRASSSFDADVEDQGAGDERGEVHGDEDASNFNLSEQWWEDTTSTSPLDVNGVSLRVVSYQRRTLFGALALPRWMWRRRPLFTLRTRSEWAPQVEVGHNPLPRTRSEWAPQAEVVDNGQPRLRPMRIGLELAVHSSALCRAMRRVERAQNLHVHAPYLSLASRWRELLIHPPPRELFLHPSLLEAATAASAYRDTRAQQGGDSGRKLKLGTGGVDDGLVNEMTIDNDGNSGGGGDGRHRRRLFSGYSSSGGSITDDDDDDDDDSASLDSVDDEDADRDPWEADDVRDELFADTAAAPNAHAVTAQESSSSSRQQRGQASRTSSTFRHSAAPLPYPGASPAAAAAASFGGAARGGLGGPAGMLSSWSWLAPRVISTLIAITSPSASSPSSVNGGDTQTTTSSGGTRTALLNIGLIDVGRALVAAVRDDASAVASNLTAATALMVDSALGPRRRRRRHEWQGGDDESSDGDGSSDNSGYSSGGGGDGAAVNTHGDTRRRRGRTSNTPVAAAMAVLRSTHAWAIAAARHPLRSASSALSALVLGAQSTQTQQRTSGGSGGTAGGTTAAPHSRRRRHRGAWPCGGRPRRRSWVAWVCGRRPRSGPHVEVELVMRSREHDSVSLRVPLLVRTGTVWSGPLLRPELLHELSRAALGAVEGTRRQWMHEAVERVVVRTHGGAAAAAASGSSQDSPAPHTSPSAPAPAMESPNFRNGQRQLQLAMESTACAGELPPSGTEGQLQQRYLLRSSSLGEGTIAPLPVQLHPSSVDGYTSFSYSEPAAAAAAAAASDAVVEQFRYRVNELWNALLLVEGAAPVSSSSSALAVSTAAASSVARHRRSDINDAASASADGSDDDATGSSHSLATNNSDIVSTLAKWIHKWKPVLRQLTELWIEENAAAAAAAAVAGVHSGSGSPAASVGTCNASAASVRGDLTGTTTTAVAAVRSSSAVRGDLTHHHALMQEHRLLQTSASAAASRASHRTSTSQTSPASPPVSRLRAIINAYVHHAVWRFCALEILQRQAQQLVRDARANNFNLGAGRNTGLAMVSLPSRKARPAASAALTTANFNLEEEIAWEGDEVAVSESRLRRRQHGNTASSDSSYPQQRATRSSAARRGEGATSTSRQGSLVSASAVEVGRDEALLCAFCVGVTALARTLA